MAGCGSCGTAFVTHPPSPPELEKYYSLDYFQGNVSKFGYVDYEAEEPFQRESFRQKADYLSQKLPGGRILDIGCATGSFLKLLGPNWEKHGVEMSRELLQSHPPPPNISVWAGDILSYPENGKPFDAVTLWDVLDHVPDPASLVQKAERLLRPGGILGLHVGDRESLFARLMGKRWHLYIPPTHLTFFSRRSIVSLLRKSGFAVDRYGYEGKWVPLSLCFFRLSYVFTHDLFRRLYEWSARSSLGRLKVYVNLMDVLTVYAVKK